MRVKYFVDTVCWIGLLNKDDELHDLADKEYKHLMKSGVHLVTTTAVLNEVANALSNPCFRSAVVEFHNCLKLSSQIDIIFIDQELWSEGWQLIGSEAIDFEIFKIPDDERKQKVTGLASMAKVKVIINAKIEKRADMLEKSGFKPMDALHLACAEDVKADVLLTTDDKFCQNILRNSKLAKVRVNNPVNWLMEVTKNEYPNFQS